MSDDPTMSKAPWTAEQIESLNGYQASGIFHPFTCGDANCRAALVATETGWTCPDCNYRQDSAHAFMADGSWRPAHEAHFGTSDPDD